MASDGGSKCSILVIEDDRFNRTLMKQQLEKEGYKNLVFAENGRIALDILGNQSFDVVLLDIEMPEMNGFEVLQAIRTDLKIRDTPVIMISAINEIESIAHCIANGAEDYLPKPFNPILLRARLSASIEKKRLRDIEKSHLAQISAEKRKSDELLSVILPASVANELKASGRVAPRSYDNVALLFVDLVDFTSYCDRHSAEDVVTSLQTLFTRFERIAASRGMEKIKTIGDAFMAIAGLANFDPDPLLSAVQCGLDMARGVPEVVPEWSARVGVHYGSVVAGVVGDQRYQFDVWGDTVNVAARMADIGAPGCVTMTHDIWLRVQYACIGRRVGSVEIKGKGTTEVVECTGFVG